MKKNYVTDLVVLIPSCRRPTEHNLLSDTLIRLKDAIPIGARLYLLDTAADDALVSSEEDFSLLEVLRYPGDSKPTAINKALREIDPCKFVAIIDDDILVPKQYFRIALEFLHAKKEASGVGGIYLDSALNRFVIRNKISLPHFLSSLIGFSASSATNTIRGSGYIANLTFRTLEAPIAGDWLFGCNAVYRYHTLLKDAPFPDGMKGWSYGDDIWVGAQLIQRGNPDSLFIHPLLSVIHLGDKVSTSRNTDSLYTILLHTYIISRKLQSGKSPSPSYFLNSLALILYYKIFLGYSGCTKSALLLVRLLLFRGKSPGFDSALFANK